MNTLKGRSVLLVDDEAEVRNCFAEYLTAMGAHVTTAVDGTEALSLYSPGRFNCVLTDYRMPRTLGSALAEQIKRTDPTQRVVMVSAFVGDILFDGNIPWYIDVLLPKPPARMSDLLDAINPPAPGK
jgi:CheY-like chemotaxis protein